MSSLDSILVESDDLLQQLITHRQGVAKVSNETTVLSTEELEYLQLYQRLYAATNGSSKPVDFDLVKTTLMSIASLRAVYNGSDSGDSELLPLMRLRDTLASQLLSQRQHNNERAEQLASLNSRNRNQHAVNQALVRQICEAYESTAAYQRDQFSSGELKEYKRTRSALAESRAKNAVLREFITSIIVATGLDWASDERLTSLVLECGELDEDLDEELDLLGPDDSTS